MNKRNSQKTSYKSMEKFKVSRRKAPLAHSKWFIRGEHPEVLEVEFANGLKEKIITIRCTDHLHCDCSLKKMLKLHSVVKNNERSRKIKKAGKVVSFIRLITRMDYFTNEITIYGPVDIAKEVEFFNTLKEKGRTERKSLFNKLGAYINCPFETVENVVEYEISK